MEKRDAIVFLLVIGLGAILMRGCVPVEPGIDGQAGGTALAQVPTIEVEATVVHLLLDPSDEREGEVPGYEYPKDIGIIRIDKIISTNNPNNWLLDGIEEGKEVEVDFTYSARPAKVRTIPTPRETGDVPPDTTVSHVPTSAQPVPKEDGYFIYVLNVTEGPTVVEKEVTLPGLDVGSRFSATISYLSRDSISVGEYVLISDQNG